MSLDPQGHHQAQLLPAPALGPSLAAPPAPAVEAKLGQKPGGPTGWIRKC